MVSPKLLIQYPALDTIMTPVRVIITVIGVFIILVLGGIVLFPEVVYETQTIELYDCDTGVVTQTETALIADTPLKQRFGLSPFPQEQVMLFEYDEVSERGIIMRGMSYDLTIVYLDESFQVHSVNTGESSNIPVIRWYSYSGVSGSGQYIVEFPATTTVSENECIRRI